MIMDKIFSLNETIRTTELLPHHDVVFRSPVCDPVYGLPIGNGSLGGLLWLGEDALYIQANHTDLIDDIEKDSEYCCSLPEATTTCKHGVQIKFNFQCPIFESIYQKSFEARLSLSDASAVIRAETGFGAADISAFCSERYDVIVVNVKTRFNESLPLICDMKRWGSRSFLMWALTFRDLPETGLYGTSAFVEGDNICLVQKLQGTTFCAALTAISDLPASRKTLGNHGAELSFPDSETLSATYYITLGIGATETQAKEIALRKLSEAVCAGIRKIRETHIASWAEFWQKSYISLPKKQDYLENLWYLNLYYANSEMKGNYPPHFCNGIWSFFHDFVPWNAYFHFNGQLSTFPLEAANHPELTETYYRFRYNQLPYARAFAKKIKNSDGAFYADVGDFKGRMVTHYNCTFNCTCGPQIAMGMYQHYLYTKDETFLETRALPLMKETAAFYLEQLKLAEDGLYHLYKTTGYEGSPLFQDSITDHAMIRSLFKALTEILPADETSAYQERLDKLAPFIETDFVEGELTEEGTFSYGIGKGLSPRFDKVLSVGKNDNGECMRKTLPDPSKAFYGVPDTEMAPLFPASVTGLSDRNGKLFRMIYNSVCIHPESLLKDGDEQSESCMGWCMMPVYLARLGESELLEKQFSQTISSWIAYPQGFGLYTPTDKTKQYFFHRYKEYQITEEVTKRTTFSPAFSFRHFDYETLPILATAVNEMLLQSYDGIIRLFPAVQKDSTFAFRLAATNGRIVSAAYDKGAFAVQIECAYGGKLSVAPENTDGEISFTDRNGIPLSSTFEKGVYSLQTSAGDIVRIATKDRPQVEISKNYDKNWDVKICGESCLGCRKYF